MRPSGLGAVSPGAGLAFAMLDPSRTLRENDVQEGDTQELVLSA